VTTYCARCKKAKATLTAYWGPALCTPCAVAVAELLDAHDKWPPVPWDDEDTQMMNISKESN
jgi:hypothetical protein